MVPLSLGAWVPKNLARRILVHWFRRCDAARPDRAGWPHDRNSWLRGPRVNHSYHPYARARARPWSPACSSPAFRAGWFLYPLARGCRRIWRGEFWFIGFGGATLLDRIGPAG